MEWKTKGKELTPRKPDQGPQFQTLEMPGNGLFGIKIGKMGPGDMNLLQMEKQYICKHLTIVNYTL